MKNYLVIGASGGIGSAVINELLQRDNGVIAVSRSPKPTELDEQPITWICSDYIEPDIAQVADTINRTFETLHGVIICNGKLHDATIQPEKRIEELGQHQLVSLFESNTIVPMLWLKHLIPALTHKDKAVVAALSARVGSLSDNQLGGWYTYRASKAALNMMLKTAAIELKRRAKNVKLIAFHPGTTDTALSKPFQSRVPKGKLFEPDFVAKQLLLLMERVEPDGELSFMDWNHKTIEW